MMKEGQMTVIFDSYSESAAGAKVDSPLESEVQEARRPESLRDRQARRVVSCASYHTSAHTDRPVRPC